MVLLNVSYFMPQPSVIINKFFFAGIVQVYSPANDNGHIIGA